MDIYGKKFVFLGDSITEGYGVADKANIFTNRLASEYHLEKALNYGIGGTRIARQTGADTCAAAYCDRFAAMDADADFVIVFGGTNDYGHGNAPFGKFEDRTETTFYGALHVLMIGLITRYPHSTIVFMTPTHRGWDMIPSQFNSRPLSDYVDAIKEVARYYSIPVLDLYAMGGMQPDVPIQKQLYMPDALHPNDAGHKLIADRLAGFLKAL